LIFVVDCVQGLDHVGFLNSAQALADYASLIAHIKSTSVGAANSPVIAFGGSYGGMLAAWLRIKYPHLIAGYEIQILRIYSVLSPLLHFTGSRYWWCSVSDKHWICQVKKVMNTVLFRLEIGGRWKQVLLKFLF
jgi:surfactin synthase thioesterase subunit